MYALSIPRLLRALVALSAVSLTACETTTAPGAAVTVRLSSPSVVGSSVATAGGLSITGTNGTLLITDIKLVVDEFELKRIDALQCNDSMPASSADCEEFESNLFVADVPLGTGAVTVANDRIPTGTYDELEFEVKDLFVDTGDADDSTRAARIATVLAELRLTYANWPAGASMMVEGTFTPTGGAAQAFRVYFDAEVEVETEFLTPLVINEASQGLTIDLRPDVWFRNGDGSVMNLALWNYSTFLGLVEFAAELEIGVEVDID